MRSSWNMWEPTWVSRSRYWLLAGERLGHVCMVPEPVGSTHLRFGDARVVMGNCMWLPKVVWSPGCHEEFRNGPKVKIYIWEVLFWSPEKFRVKSVMYRDHREGPGGPGTLPITSETFPVTKTGLPIYKSLPPDHSGTPHDVRDLIRDSEQHSVTTYILSL